MYIGVPLQRFPKTSSAASSYAIPPVNLQKSKLENYKLVWSYLEGDTRNIIKTRNKKGTRHLKKSARIHGQRAQTNSPRLAVPAVHQRYTRPNPLSLRNAPSHRFRLPFLHVSSRSCAMYVHAKISNTDRDTRFAR